MSKESRRRQRMAGQPSGDRPGRAPTQRPAAEPARAPTALDAHARARQRAGRRERARPAPAARSSSATGRWLIAAVVVVAVVPSSASACSRPPPSPRTRAPRSGSRTPTAAPAEGASPQPGYVQPDMGNAHVAAGHPGHLHLLPAGLGAALQRRRRRPDPRPALRPRRRRDPAGLGAQPRARRPRDPVPRTPSARPRPAAAARCSTRFPPSPVCGFQPGGSRPGRSSPGSSRWRGRTRPSSGIACCRWRRSTRRPILDFYPRYGERTNPEKLCQRVAEPVGRPRARARVGRAAAAHGCAGRVAERRPPSAAAERSPS